MQVDKPTVEAYAKALWLAREYRRTTVALGDEPPRAWEAYAEGQENYDCARFEFNRDDHRTLVEQMFERLEHLGDPWLYTLECREPWTDHPDCWETTICGIFTSIEACEAWIKENAHDWDPSGKHYWFAAGLDKVNSVNVIEPDTPEQNLVFWDKTGRRWTRVQPLSAEIVAAGVDR